MRERAAFVLEIAVLLGALATVPVIVLEHQGMTGPLLTAADWIIWLLFVAEFAAGWVRVSDHRLYLRRRWMSAVVIAVSFPPLPGLFSAVRLARLAQFPGVLRLGMVTVRGLTAAQAVLTQRAFLNVAVSTALLVLGSSTLLVLVEPDTVHGDFGLALWWALVTVTTVGYGDIVPASIAGRFAAILLMFAGIGFVSALSAAIVSHYVGEQGRKDSAALDERLARIEAGLDRLERAVKDSRSPKSP
jgi:voltage-gated potassium channel